VSAALTRHHESSVWLRGRLADLATRLTTGQYATCGHLHAGDLAGVAFWEPGFLMCERCARPNNPTGDEKWTCDRCGTVNPDDCTSVATMLADNLVAMFGLCTACIRREGVVTPDDLRTELGGGR